MFSDLLEVVNHGVSELTKLYYSDITYLPCSLEKAKEVGVLRMEPKVRRQALRHWALPLARKPSSPNTLSIRLIFLLLLEMIRQPNKILDLFILCS